MQHRDCLHKVTNINLTPPLQCLLSAWTFLCHMFLYNSLTNTSFDSRLVILNIHNLLYNFTLFFQDAIWYFLVDCGDDRFPLFCFYPVRKKIQQNEKSHGSKHKLNEKLNCQLRLSSPNWCKQPWRKANPSYHLKLEKLFFLISWCLGTIAF